MKLKEQSMSMQFLYLLLKIWIIFEVDMTYHRSSS